MSKRIFLQELIKLDAVKTESNQAETSSGQSVLPLSYRTGVTRATQAIGILFYIVIEGIPYWQTDVIYRTFGSQAFRCNYNGEWSTVQALLESEEHTPEQYIEIFLKNHSKEDLFGNYLHRDKLQYFKRLIFARDLSKPDTRPVRYAQRKRGYSDKGSRRLPHEFHGDPPIRTKEREDRRKFITHPLLRSEENLKPQVSECADAYFSPEERRKTNEFNTS